MEFVWLTNYNHFEICMIRCSVKSTKKVATLYGSPTVFQENGDHVFTQICELVSQTDKYEIWVWHTKNQSNGLTTWIMAREVASIPYRVIGPLCTIVHISSDFLKQKSVILVQKINIKTKSNSNKTQADLKFFHMDLAKLVLVFSSDTCKDFTTKIAVKRIILWLVATFPNRFWRTTYNCNC